MSRVLRQKSPKLKGSICNIPISEVDKNFMSLPWRADSNGLIVVKLKLKAEYRSHVLFEVVTPSFVGSFLRFLKQFYQMYSNIEFDLDNIAESLTNFGHKKRKLHAKIIKQYFWTVGY